MTGAVPAAFRPRAVLFDLDGTLIDSVPDITLAASELVATDGLPPFAEAEVRRMVGLGVAVLVERAYAARGVVLDAVAKAERMARMMDIYPRHLMGRTRLMPGVAEAIAAFSGMSARLAVVTNKPQVATETILDHFDLAGSFQIVVGDRPFGDSRALARKPAPDMLLHALAELGVPSADAMMVGDSPHDIEASHAAGVLAVGVRGGYTTEPLEHFHPALLVDSLAELPHLFTRAA